MWEFNRKNINICHLKILVGRCDGIPILIYLTFYSLEIANSRNLNQDNYHKIYSKGDQNGN
jgi:hypothetical protein